MAPLVNNLPAMQETLVQFLGREDPLEKGWWRDRLPTPVFFSFPGGSAGKESACNVGDLDSIPELGRSPGEGKGYPFQYSGLENSMDSIVHGVAKSQTWLSDLDFTSLPQGMSSSNPDVTLDGSVSYCVWGFNDGSHGHSLCCRLKEKHEEYWSWSIGKSCPIIPNYFLNLSSTVFFPPPCFFLLFLSHMQNPFDVLLCKAFSHVLQGTFLQSLHHISLTSSYVPQSILLCTSATALIKAPVIPFFRINLFHE